jgi:hypothetical protein
MMDVLRQWNGDSLLLAEGRDWHDRRRKVLPAFQSRRLPAYGELVVAETARLCDGMAHKADSDGAFVFDVDQTMARLSLDIAIRTMFGADNPTQGHQIEAAVQDLSDVAFAETTSSITIPRWLPLPIARRKYRAMKVMEDFLTGLVSEALQHPARVGAHLISSLIEHHEGRADAIRDDAMSLLIAGHETSGALLTWAFAMLATSRPGWTGPLTRLIRCWVPNGPTHPISFGCPRSWQYSTRLCGFFRPPIRCFSVKPCAMSTSRDIGSVTETLFRSFLTSRNATSASSRTPNDLTLPASCASRIGRPTPTCPSVPDLVFVSDRISA